jgi:fatty-acyl-CoA synthase
MSTGDVGHFDAAGRLFIDGRDDDMIVSGGKPGPSICQGNFKLLAYRELITRKVEL